MFNAGFPVPPGFCITTEAYRTFLQASSEMEEMLSRLDRLKADQLQEISNIGKLIRHHIESITMPEEIKTAIIDGWKKSGEEWAYAVRSSATAEDLPSASFAGQQDTYLNVIGADQILQAVKKCWASCSPTGPLFTACRTDLFIVRFFIGSGTAHGFSPGVRNHVYSRSGNW